MYTSPFHATCFTLRTSPTKYLAIQRYAPYAHNQCPRFCAYVLNDIPCPQHTTVHSRPHLTFSVYKRVIILIKTKLGDDIRKARYPLGVVECRENVEETNSRQKTQMADRSPDPNTPKMP
ncbi:hypothetical protein Pcinc_003168 [Petrolisthes cinctipes]|uniref:Uncharacterized protein n=1 Tax=Petrolisthes cinctipes TaxID=88211 RepID=A0AAE1L1K1_PETCI|nr:hypothetical protein Pcinc_003168 [Petrolisthes cinctipes]